MFCSRCGKTIYPGDEKCKYCGQSVGASRFMGTADVAAYTAAQSREEAPAVERDDKDFTRTSYMSPAQEEEAPREESQDVTRRTVYRPVLRDEEAEGRTNRDTFPEPEEAPEEETKKDAPAKEPETASARPGQEETQPRQKGRPRTKIDLKPVKLAGISPEVQAYMSNLDENIKKSGERKNGGVKLPKFGAHPVTEADEGEEEGEESGRTGLKFHLPKVSLPKFAKFGRRNPEEEDEEEDELQREDIERAAAYAADQDETEPESEEDEGGEDEEEDQESGLDRFLAKVAGWFGKLGSMDRSRQLKMVGIALAVILVLVLGSLWLGRVTADRAKIDGVSYSVYSQGISLVENNASDTYFEEIRNLYYTNSAGVTSRFNQELAKVSALTPEKPGENDAAFVDTLYTIQDSINTTATVYTLSRADGAAASLTDDYNSDIARIRNAIGSLKTATTLDELKAIKQAATVSITDSSSDDNPDDGGEIDVTTSQYIKLTKGMMNSNDVFKMQERLIELGYLEGEADGSFGSKTEVAVKRFQKAAGYETDGIATPELQELMYSANAPRRAGAGATPSPTAVPAPEQGGSDAQEAPAPGQEG